MAVLAITGGTGFVGARLLECALDAGHSVRALARREQRPRERTAWVRGDLFDAESLRELCAGADAVIHVAGLVNAAKRRQFFACNVEGTRNMLAASAGVPRFVHVSSIAAREPGLSVYGRSKAGGDALVMAEKRDWVILRPPAVYGPGDKDMALFYRLIARGWALLPGGGRFSLIEVGDLARALLALATGTSGTSGTRQVLEIDDGTPGGLSHRDYAGHIAAALGRHPRFVTLPSAALKVGAAVDTAIARVRGDRLPVLSFDRTRYIAHPDWVADSAALRALEVWSPRVPVADGIARTAAWYRKAGWI